MRPRLVSRTHYQVDEPKYLSILCSACVSGSQTAYRETVAERFANELRSRNKQFNTAAGGYAVDLAKSLFLITDDHVLTDKGHLVRLFGEATEGNWDEQMTLSTRERLLYFKVFLEADGAALVYLIHRILRDCSLPGQDATWNSLATDMFVSIYSDYLGIARETVDRVALRRQRDRTQSKGYSGKSGPHQMFLHVQTLSRLGLIVRSGAGAGKSYTLPDSAGGGAAPLHAFVQLVPDVVALERCVERGGWIEVAGHVFFEKEPACPVVDSSVDFLSLAIPLYRRVMSTGVPLCPLTTLIDAVQIELLASGRGVLRYDAAMSSLTAAQKGSPKHIRFHVDRRGQPAFVRLSSAVLDGTQE